MACFSVHTFFGLLYFVFFSQLTHNVWKWTKGIRKCLTFFLKRERCEHRLILCRFYHENSNFLFILKKYEFLRTKQGMQTGLCAKLVFRQTSFFAHTAILVEFWKLRSSHIAYDNFFWNFLWGSILPSSYGFHAHFEEHWKMSYASQTLVSTSSTGIISCTMKFQSFQATVFGIDKWA